jgi:NADH dehydrogenase FAD-containing subunit
MANVPSKTVVIVGAAWAGINVAHGLLKQVPNVNVVLVNPSGKLQGFTCIVS